MENKTSYSKMALKRIICDIRILNKSKKTLEEQGIYFHFDEEYIGQMYALIIGTEDTPYEKGFYFFKFTYPIDYPKRPPKVKFCSIDGRSRMNPNLYKEGKVCLSIINTWSGPGWLPTFTTDKVLIAIQAMVMNDYPLRNEPGFESSTISELDKYNTYVEHQNFELAIIKMLENTPEDFLVFKDIIEKYFYDNFTLYRKKLLFLNDKKKTDSLVKAPCYSCTIHLKYPYMLEKMEDLYEKISEKFQ